VADGDTLTLLDKSCCSEATQTLELKKHWKADHGKDRNWKRESWHAVECGAGEMYPPLPLASLLCRTLRGVPFHRMAIRICSTRAEPSGIPPSSPL
jgi:hypothetical protein